MAYTEFYCNSSTGSNMNGGSDENTTPSYSATNGGWDSSTGVFTPTSGNPSASVTVGQFAHVFTDGSTTPTFVGRVTAVNSTTITVSTTAKSGTAPTTAGTGISINVGGVWLGPNTTENWPIAGVSNAMTNSSGHTPRINLKNNATYDVTQGSTISGGSCYFWGYTSTIGDGGFAQIRGAASGGSAQLFSSASNASFRYIHFTRHLGGSNAYLINNTGSSISFQFCRFSEFGGHIFTTSGGGTGMGVIRFCEFWDWNVSAVSGKFAIGAGGTTIAIENCVFANSTNSTGTAAINCSSPTTIRNCIFTNCGGNAIISSGSLLVHDCDFYSNSSSGISMSGTSQAIINNCNFIANGAWGITSSGNRIVQLLGNAYGAGTQANTSGTYNLTTENACTIEGTITYANDVTPWNDPDNEDFTVTLAAAKGTGYSPVFFSQGTAPSYPDVGALQHQDAGGSSVKGMRILGG